MDIVHKAESDAIMHPSACWLTETFQSSIPYLLFSRAVRIRQSQSAAFGAIPNQILSRYWLFFQILRAPLSWESAVAGSSRQGTGHSGADSVPATSYDRRRLDSRAGVLDRLWEGTRLVAGASIVAK
jgi:hypothetical protein